MDPVTLILTTLFTAGSTIFGTISGNKAAKKQRLPDWLSPRDFQRKDYTLEIIIGGIALIIIVILAITAWKAKK